MARPGVVVTMASAGDLCVGRAVEGDRACGMGLVNADQPVGGHVERAGHAGPVRRHHRRLVGGAVAAVQPLEDAGGRAAAPGEEAMPHLVEDGGCDDLEACGQGRHRVGRGLLSDQGQAEWISQQGPAAWRTRPGTGRAP
jgi:hypothetical protein